MSPGKRRLRPEPRPASWFTRYRTQLILTAFVVVGTIATLVWDTQEARTEAAVVTEQRDDTAEQAVNLAAQIQAACRTDELNGPVCQTAARVVREPVPGEPGVNGQPGVDGRGVTSTSIVAGRLVINYSDGSTQDVGEVVGRDGADGVGITATTIENGQLVVLYSDNRRMAAGPVVGAVGSPGRGVQAVSAQDGRLVVTYTDGATEDAGPLPQGPRGVDGVDGRDGADGADGSPGGPAPTVQSETRTFTDGSVQRCTRTGGSDSEPRFDCELITPAPDPDADESGNPIEFVGG